MKFLVQVAPLLLAGRSCLAISLQGRHASREHGDGAVSPVQQVISLLGDLEAKINKAAAAEDGAYKKYSDWCSGGTKDKEYDIKTAQANIEDLTATIGKAQSDISTSSAKIQELAGVISGNERDVKAATEVREKENSEFLAAETELLDVVETLDRAVNVLERKMKASALVQARFMAKVDTKDVNMLVKSLSAVVDAAALSIHDKQRLIALAQSRTNADEEEDEVGAPAPDAYKSHGDGIIDVLEDMREKAETQLAELRKQEVNGKHNYEMTKQSVEDQIKADMKDMDDAKATASSATETKATADGDLTVTQKDLKDSEESLELMTSGCMTAASDHDASVLARGEELKVLAEAKKILLDTTSGAGEQAYSFIQLDGRGKITSSADLANFEVVNLVRRLAKKSHSPALTQLASRIQAAMKLGTESGADPFEKVKGLLTDMIMKLEQEAGQEASHKAYCDKEMAGTQEKLDDLESTLSQLRAKIDKKKSSSVSLKNEVQELQAELAYLAKSQAEADSIRREENKIFGEKKVDLTLGLKGVRQALKVLREYYAQEATGAAAAAFVQSAAAGKQDPEMPEFHTKADGASTGIIGMLEVVESDFGKGLAQAEMEEDTSATEYEKISMSNRLTKATKEQDVTYKTKESAELDKQVAEHSSDGESAQTELDAVLEYSKSIRGQCTSKPETFEERKGRREAEISGLREALSILEGEAVFLQMPRKLLKALRGSL
mmetsp:Transcript_158808/g.509087  ORF Transcript_158808/g.509087 Transcript_158808/m.509087 type:complete len:725 (+) Transcript_158808:55-2229(+)